MKIPASLLEKWEPLKSPGDSEKIAEMAKVTVQTVYAAFVKGECSDDVFKSLASFYREKEKIINQFID